MFGAKECRETSNMTLIYIHLLENGEKKDKHPLTAKPEILSSGAHIQRDKNTKWVLSSFLALHDDLRS